MTIFVRTDQGQVEAYSTDSTLPRKLRSILKMVDGRTALRTFEQNLQSFGDVKSILYSLAEAGLVSVQPEGAQHIRVNMNISDAEKQRLMEPDNAAHWMPTRSPYAEHSQPHQAPVNHWPAEQQFLIARLPLLFPKYR